MAEIASLVQKYLGTLSKAKRLNYYTAVGLDELTSDRANIARAIETAIEKLKTADRSVDPEGFEQVVKVVRQVRHTLLDEDKKRAYDTQLKGNAAASSSASSKSSTSKSPIQAQKQPISAPNSIDNGKLVKMQTFLPLGDPDEPFSMAAYLSSSIPDTPFESAQDRKDAIATLIHRTRHAGPIESTEEYTPYEEYSPDRDESAQYMASHTNDYAENHFESPLAMPSFASAAPRRSTSTLELQVAIRKKQKSQQRMLLSGVLLGALMLVSIAGFFFYKNVTDKQNRLAAREAAQEAEKVKIQKELGEQFNLPHAPDSVDLSEDGDAGMNNGIGAGNRGNGKRSAASDRRAVGKQGKKNQLNIRNDLGDANSGMNQPLPSPNSANMSDDKMATNPSDTNASNMVANMPAANEEMKPANAPSPTAPATPETTTPPVKEMPMQRADRPAWAKAMNAARTAMISRDFERFNKEIETALELSGEDAEMLEKQKRLDMLGQVYQMGKEAFDKGFASLKSVKDLPYGNSSKALVIEVTKDVLVLRIAGKNERFPLDKIPMGIVVAIAELNMGKTPTELAIRGAIYQLNEQSTPEHKKRALDFFNKAAAGDSKFTGLERVVTDKYE